MKQKLNKGVNPFSYKKKFSDYEDDDRRKLYNWVTGVKDGNLAGSLRFYTNLKSSNQNQLVELLRTMFSKKYPYKDINKFGNYVTYFCDKDGSKTKSSVRNHLKEVVAILLKEQAKVNAKQDDPKDENAPEGGYISEYFPLRAGMQGDKTKKLNDFLLKNGNLAYSQGALFTDATLAALKSYLKYSVQSLSESEYNKMFEVKATNTNSLLSGNNLYIIIAVVIVVAIFFFFKRKKQ